METALASQTSTLPLKALYTDFLNNFPLNVKAGDTLPSNPWAQALKTRVTDTLGELAERYDLKLNPLAAVGAIRVKGGQYINFCKKPLKTSRGFYPYIWFSFDNKNVGYALGFSDDNDVPKTFIETLSTVGRKRLPDFTESSRQGLPQKTINLEQTTDEELTSDLIRLLDTYTECVNQLEDEIEEFISNTRTNQLTGSLPPEQLEVVLDEFIAWCEANPADQHLLDERPVAYANWSKEYFSNLPAADLVKEMTDFVAQGGKLQTGGARGKTKFAKQLAGREEEFRAHLTKAYDPNLDLEQWWEDSRSFPGFGQGIRSIFLHRAHPTHYAIYNQKALDGYRILGVLPTRSKRSQVSYTDVNTAAHTILAKRPDKLSLYLVDHLTHFITIPQGEALIQSLLNSNPEQGDDIAQECYKTWIIAGGERGRATQSFIQTNSISIDFDIRQDLTQFNTEQKIRTIIATAHNTTLDRHSWTSSCYSFAHKMKVGDLVILRSGLREINAVGVVTSRCTYQSHRETFPHVRQVEWVFVGERVLPDEIPQFRQATFVELTPDSPRVEAIKQLTNWTEFEAKISEIRAKVILAAPFLKIFLDREEAHTAFNLIKDTLERLEERDPKSDRLALTLPNAGSQISLSYGARLLLHLRRDEGQLVISSVLEQHDLATGEHFEGGEFSANGKGVGIGLKHRVLADFEQSEQHKQRYLSAVEALKTLSDHRTPYARWHIPQLVEAALDPAARENLFTNGLNNFATEQPYFEQSITIPTEKQMAKGRNVIYFGPPGTGKTWTLLNKERQRFIAPASSISKDEQLKALVADQPWWVVLGAALLKMGPSNVPALKQHPLVKARFAITDIKAPSSSLWVPLQMHT
ncbi:MAG: hypothetical protein ACK5Y6_07085, partial [Pseudomonadota bacterium]